MPLAVGIAIGRVGCYLAGIEDFTYGTATDLPWAHDFGDGIPRHPVQLYEAMAMALFTIGYGVALRRRNGWIVRNGFALLVLYYGAQRFLLEFLKPYPTIFIGLTVFQIVCIAMVIYALLMLSGRTLAYAGRD